MQCVLVLGSSRLPSSGLLLFEGVQVRKVNFGRLTRGVLHSKFWIVDRKHVFIGSANMDWRALTQVTIKTPTITDVLNDVLNVDTLPDSFTIYFYLQVKELGVVVYNCSSLAKDLYKIFQSYWVMGQPNSSLPQHWPAKYDTAINKHHPLLVKMDNVSSRLYLTVSSFYFSSVLQDTVLLMDKGLLSLFTQK